MRRNKGRLAGTVDAQNADLGVWIERQIDVLQTFRCPG